MCFKRKTVTVTVCVETSLLANQYCPVQAARTYYKNPRDGEPVAPTTTCAVHHEAPAYPPVADQSSPRTGVDYYQMICFPKEDIIKYLDDHVTNGGSVLRVFMDFTWPETQVNAGWKYSIFKQVGWWVDEGGEFDGETFPLFTIGQTSEYGLPYNPDIVDKWKWFFRECAARGIRVTVSVLDGCSMWTGIAKRHQPLLQNIQHHGADGTSEYTRMDGTIGHGLSQHTGGIYGGFGSEVDGNMVDYMDQIIPFVTALIRESGVDYRIMPGNEMQNPVDESHGQEEQDKCLQDYLNYWISTLRSLGVPNERIVLSIAGTHVRDRVTVPLTKQYAGVVEQMHGPNSDASLDSFMSSYPDVEMDGDGFDPHAEGYTNEEGYTMPSLDQCRGIRAILSDPSKNPHNFEYHIFNGHAEGDGWQDITRAQWNEQKSLAGKE